MYHYVKDRGYAIYPGKVTEAETFRIGNIGEIYPDDIEKLYEIMTDTDGIYGGRFSGAGFKGCCMALIDPDRAEDIEVKVTTEYLKAFPALDGKYSFHLCESADGVEL